MLQISRSGSRGTRADQGVRPTIYAGFAWTRHAGVTAKFVGPILAAAGFQPALEGCGQNCPPHIWGRMIVEPHDSLSRFVL
jgi:hypothetical protein